MLIQDIHPQSKYKHTLCQCTVWMWKSEATDFEKKYVLSLNYLGYAFPCACHQSSKLNKRIWLIKLCIISRTDMWHGNVRDDIRQRENIQCYKYYRPYRPHTSEQKHLSWHYSHIQSGFSSSGQSKIMNAKKSAEVCVKVQNDQQN